MEKTAGLRDIPAVQGILVLGGAIGIFAVNLLCPALCREILEALRELLCETPTPAELLRAAVQWFL